MLLLLLALFHIEEQSLQGTSLAVSTRGLTITQNPTTCNGDGWVGDILPFFLRDETFKKQKAHANETVLKFNPAKFASPPGK